MSHFILMHLEAHRMSWGSNSYSMERNTDLIPTRSGVGGLIANAMGLNRDDPDIDSLMKQIRISVKVLRSGNPYTDYQNIHFWDVSSPEDDQTDGYQEIVVNKQSWRDYLTDAAFQVALEVLPGRFTPEEVLYYLKNPIRPLYLGRKVCPPSYPVCMPNDVVHERDSAWDLLQDKGLFDAIYKERNWVCRGGDLVPVSYKPLQTLYLDAPNPPKGGMNVPRKRNDVNINNVRRSFTYRTEHIWNPRED